MVLSIFKSNNCYTIMVKIAIPIYLFAHSYTVSYIPIQYSSFFIKPIGWTLTGTTTLGQNGPGWNGNNEMFHTPQTSRSRASPSDVD